MISNTLDGVRSVTTADFDGDGDLDVLVSSLLDSTVSWFENVDGLGTYGIEQVIITEPGGVASTTAADIDGDGDLDVVAGYFTADEVVWFENTDGLGTFGPEQTVSNNTDGARLIAVADVDGDGDLDVLSNEAFDSTIVWYENTDGLGTFATEQVVANVISGTNPFTTADVDGDGDLDVLVATPNNDTVSWYENTDGLGTFGAEQVITNTAIGANFVAAADVDGDGDLDVLFTSSSNNTVAWLENTDGLGAFGAEQIITNGAVGASSVTTADIDGDGDLDVLTTSATDNTVAWFVNTDGLGSFSAEQVITNTADGVNAVAAADVDGDGDLDVLVASLSDDTVAWFENINGSVLINDTDADGNSLTATLVTDVSNGTLSLNPNGTFTYTPDADFNGVDSFTYMANDGTVNSNIVTVTLNVTAVNDAPVANVPVGPLVATEQTVLTIHGAGFSISDVDAANADVFVILTVGEGTLTVTKGDSDVSIGTSIGNVMDANTLAGGGTVVLSGTVAQINDLLAGTTTGTIVYLNGSDTPSASTTLTVTVNDQGNTGTDPGLTGDALSEEGSNNVVINITAVNDAPVVNAPGAALTATEQTNLNIHGAGFTVSDVDEADAGATATLTVGEGNLTIVAGDSGISITSGNGTGAVVVSGTIAQINNLLAGTGTGTITYLNSSNTPSASTTLTVTVNDQGNTGTDPGLTGDALSEEGSEQCHY